MSPLTVAQPASAQSVAGHHLGAGLLNGCRAASVHDVIFVGRPLVGGGPSGSGPTPVHVERAFRGITATTVSVSWPGDRVMDEGQSYLMYGDRGSAGSVVRIQYVLPVMSDPAQMAIHLFTSAMPHQGYVTLMGVVEVGDHPDRAPSMPLTGLRIRLQSDDFAKDLFTEENGSFSAAGIPPGRLELTPVLPEALKVFDVKALTYTAAADECVLQMIFVVASTRRN